MVKRIGAKFFRVSPKPNGSPDFHDILSQSWNSGNYQQREKTVAGGIIIRLERHELSASYVIGEFCRKLTDDIPPNAGPNGLTPIDLGEGRGLGYTASFMYHYPTRTILLEKNKMSATPGRISLYLRSWNAAAEYFLSPIVREDAWERFRTGNVKKLQIKVAGPQNLEAIEGMGESAARSAVELAQAYGGVEINMEISVGRSRQTFLDKVSVTRALRFFSDSGRADKIKVVSEDEDGTEMIDFIDEALEATKEIDLSGMTIDQAHTAKRAFLRDAFRDNIDYIKRLYGGE